MLVLQLSDEAAMVALGAAIGEALLRERHALIFLEGGLGAGKTTLSRGIVTALGHSGPVKSPTYTLVEPYELDDCKLYHFDLYRLADPEELEYMGIRDYLGRSGEQRQYCLIEWPERGRDILPSADMTVRIAVADVGRRLELEALTPVGENLLRNLAAVERG